jgi:hypothetical protein
MVLNQNIIVKSYRDQHYLSIFLKGKLEEITDADGLVMYAVSDTVLIDHIKRMSYGVDDNAMEIMVRLVLDHYKLSGISRDDVFEQLGFNQLPHIGRSVRLMANLSEKYQIRTQQEEIYYTRIVNQPVVISKKPIPLDTYRAVYHWNQVHRTNHSIDYLVSIAELWKVVSDSTVPASNMVILVELLLNELEQEALAELKVQSYPHIMKAVLMIRNLSYQDEEDEELRCKNIVTRKQRIGDILPEL